MISRQFFLSKSPSWVLSFCHNFNFIGSPVQLLVKDAQWPGLTSDFVPISRPTISFLCYTCLAQLLSREATSWNRQLNPVLHLVPGNKYWRIKPPRNSHPLSSRPPNHNQAMYMKQESVTNKCHAEGRCSIELFFFFPWDRWSRGKNRGTIDHFVLCEPWCPF